MATKKTAAGITVTGAIAGILLGLPTISAAQAEPRPDRWPPVFEAEYDVHRSGLKIAKVRRRVTPLGGSRFEYSSETKTVGMAALFRKTRISEKSVWNFHDNTPKPDRYHYRRTGGKKNRATVVEFDREQRKITNTGNGDSWEMPAEPVLMDKLLYQIALMLDLEAGNSRAAYTIADGRKIRQYRFEKLGREIITTPLGEFDTVKMIRYKDNGKRSVILWCAEALRFLPVKVENTGKDHKKSVALLRSLHGLPGP